MKGGILPFLPGVSHPAPSTNTYLVWEPRRQKWIVHPSSPPPSGQLIRADSFGIFGGRAYKFKERLGRFLRFIGKFSPEIPSTSQLRSILPREGFPRLEFRYGNEGFTVGVWLRPRPPLLKELVLIPYPQADPRLFPDQKGPDLDLLERLRNIYPPGTEILLCDEEGRVREGSRTTLFIYKQGRFIFPRVPHCQRGNTPHPHSSFYPTRYIPVYRGITARILQKSLKLLGVYSEGELTLEDLTGAEVYCANSLQGVIPVVKLSGIPLATPLHTRTLQAILAGSLSL